MLCAYAQKPYLYFNRISTQNGLSHNKVNCIIQDSRGFIWIGTDDGLNRYDGNYFTIFRNIPGDSTTLSGNIITDLIEDKQGIIWIATADGGLSKYDYRMPAAKQFKQFKHRFGYAGTIPVNIINGLLEDNNGYLWLATSDHYVLRFNKKTEEFVSIGMGTKTVLSLCLADENMLWAGRQGGGILKINTSDLTYEMDKRYTDLYAGNLPHVAVTALYKDKNKDIWMGSWDNVLYRYNNNTGRESVFSAKDGADGFPDDEVLSFEESKDGKLWMGGHYHGLTIYDPQQKKFYNYNYDAAKEGTVADKQVNCIFRDNTGRMWLGTNKGISIYNPFQKAFVQTFLHGENKDVFIYDFLKENNGRLWLGTNEGIYVRNTDNDNFTLRPVVYNGEKLAVSKFFIDGTTWYIGTNYSLFTYNPVTNAIALLPGTDKDPVMKKIIDSRIVSIIKDSIEGHPVLLVSPYGHYITYYDLIEKKWVSRADTVKQIINRFNIKDNLIRKFYSTADGNTWLATGKYGLGYWPGNGNNKIDHLCNNPSGINSISNDNVYDIIQDKTGNLWVSTFGGGLNYYNIAEKKFIHAAATNNLSEGIQLDSNQNVWGISNGNIYRYNPSTKTNTSFQLPDLEKSGGIKGNIYKDASGNMYVAGNSYFIQFNPATVKETNIQSSVHFTDFKIFNNSSPELLTEKNIRLRYFQNYFTIEFAAPDFSGNAIEYSYRLQPFEKEWNEIGSRNFVNYSNLPGGDYTFEVRATNKKGNWGVKVATLNITIIPPFWQQWWFYLLCSAFIAAVIFFIYRYRINELVNRQAIRNKIAQDLHDSMGSTLSSISVYSQVAKIYHRQNKEELLEQTLAKIGDTSGEMISEMGDIVWAINPKNDHLNTIIQRMESFAKPLLQAKNIGFSFKYNISSPELNMQMDKRKNFYLIFKEAINNVLKYANCKKLDVTITQHNHSIELTISDDGVGFDTDKINIATSKSLSGNGLKNMQVRAAEMNAVYKLESKPGKGTTLYLTIHIP